MMAEGCGGMKMCSKVECDDRCSTLNVPTAMDLCAVVELSGIWIILNETVKK